MKGKYNREKSWEKQWVWDLENGWEATEEYGCYGDFIKRLDSPDGKIWLCSNGTKKDGLGADHYNKIFGHEKYIDLPDFAAGWLDDKGIVRRGFEEIGER